MSTLTVLNQQQAIDFIKSRDLKEGTEEFRTYSALLLLSPDTFVRVISAIAQGLVPLSAVRALPAINDRLIEQLIMSRLSETDEAVIAYRYRTEWFPAYVDVPAFRESVVGNNTGYIGATMYDATELLVTPEYDFLERDENKFQSYSEAFDAYMRGANSDAATDALTVFFDAHASFSADYPSLAPTTAGSIYASILSLQKEATFLRRPQLSVSAFRKSVFAFLASGVFRYISAGNLDRFMDEIAFPAMAANVLTDPAHSGQPAVAAIRTAHQWGALPEDSSERLWQMARNRIARVRLPDAYGMADPADVATEVACIGYLEAARLAILRFREVVNAQTVHDPLLPTEVPGAPIGMLLILTHN